MEAWTKEQVCEFMTAKGFAELGASLAEQEVECTDLESLTAEELLNVFAVPNFGRAKRILRAIEDARKAGVDNRSGQEDVLASPSKRLRDEGKSAGAPSPSQSKTSISSPKGHARGQGSVCKGSPGKGRGKAASSGKMSSPGKSNLRASAFGALMNQGDIDFAQLERKYRPISELVAGDKNVWVKGRVTKKVGVRTYKRQNALEEEHKLELFYSRCARHRVEDRHDRRSLGHDA